MPNEPSDGGDDAENSYSDMECIGVKVACKSCDDVLPARYTGGFIEHAPPDGDHYHHCFGENVKLLATAGATTLEPHHGLRLEYTNTHTDTEEDQ